MNQDVIIQLTCRIQSKNPDDVLGWLTNILGLKAACEEKLDGSQRAKIYLKDKKEVLKVKKQLLKTDGFAFSFSEFRISTIPFNQWTTRWKKGLKSLKISDKLVICPSWVSYKKKGKEKVIQVDPGMAFGTGHHDTTRMCLEWLEELAPSVQSVCDVGCGSGILAICAAKLGVKKILALDIDSEAIEIAQKNARINGVLPKIRFLTGSLKEKKIQNHYDIILANLTAQDIQKNWKELKALAHTGKTLLILAGIEKSQEAWFEPWLKKEKKWTIIDQKKTSDWIGYLLAKKLK